MTIDTAALRTQWMRMGGYATVNRLHAQPLILALIDELEAARAACIRWITAANKAWAELEAAEDQLEGIRAAALEEAAHTVAAAWGPAASDAIRALATQPPGVVCVKREDLARVRKNLEWISEGEDRCVDHDLLQLLDGMLK